ncbi:MAG TPA: amidohydrolase family protein [Bryobacteraceae bacterium]|nr:amidohydrolase family protein [Bryobacteraceae bacterium]
MKPLLLGLLPLVLCAASASDDSFLLRGATIHTMAGADIQNGAILVRNGKIIGVGKSLSAPKDVKVIDARGMHVYPGLIDAGTEIGLVEVNAVRETEDTTEIGKFNPQLVALTAVNPSSEHIPVTRVNGITTVAAMPQGQLVAGQVSLIHLDGWTTDEMGVKARAGLHLRLPAIQAGGRAVFIPDANPGALPGLNRGSFAALKKNFDQEMAELNGFFDSARRYKLAKEAKTTGFKPDLRLESMIPVIEGKEPILVSARKEREIRNAIDFADKQRVRIILCDAPEAYKAAKELKERDIPVILGPSLALPQNQDDAYDESYATAAELQKAGVKFSFATLTGGTNLASRNLPFQAAQAVAFGLPHDEALKALTRNAAEIWGVSDQIGTVEEGKWADLLVTDGDPLEARTQVKLLFIKGRPVDLNNRQKDLYEKYLNRP